METWKKAAIGATVVMVLAVGVRVGMIYHERHEEAKPVEQPAQAKMDPDDLVFLKQMRPDSMKDIKELIGKTVWVSAGGQLDYYKYANHKADYSKSAGLLLGAEPLVIKDAFEQVPPKTATFRIPGGDRHVLLAFTLPKSNDTAAVYATPVGYHDAGQYTFLTDQILFYEDPHTLYKWPAEDWAAVDAHKVIPGMSERQVALSLGQISKSESQDVGNRTVNFDYQGHPVDVTFVNNKVTAIH